MVGKSDENGAKKLALIRFKELYPYFKKRFSYEFKGEEKKDLMQLAWIAVWQACLEMKPESKGCKMYARQRVKWRVSTEYQKELQRLQREPLAEREAEITDQRVDLDTIIFVEKLISGLKTNKQRAAIKAYMYDEQVSQLSHYVLHKWSNKYASGAMRKNIDQKKKACAVYIPVEKGRLVNRAAMNVYDKTELETNLDSCETGTMG